MGRDQMKTTRNYVRFEGEGDDAKQIHCGPDEATCTLFTYTDVMPDGDEYGLMVIVTEVMEELDPDRHKVAVRSLEKYRKDHE